jgi:hypothetical protein
VPVGATELVGVGDTELVGVAVAVGVGVAVRVARTVGAGVAVRRGVVGVGVGEVDCRTGGITRSVPDLNAR